MSHLCGGGHWKAIRKTAVIPHTTVTALVVYIIKRCLTTGVTAVKGTNNESFAATSVNTKSISPIYMACNT